MDDLSTIRSEALGAVQPGGRPGRPRAARVAALGKKGSVTGLMKTLGGLAPEQRARVRRAALNQLKGEIDGGARGAQGGARRRGARRPAGQPSGSTSPCRRGRRPRAASIRSARPSTRSSRSSARWASPSPKGPTSRTTSTISPRSTSRPTIRRGRCRTPSTCRRAPTARRWCCAPTPRRCRSRTMLAQQAADPHHRARPHLSASTTTRPTRRCSTRSRGW